MAHCRAAALALMRSIDTQLRSATPTHILDNCRLCVIFDSCRLRHFDNAASFLTIAAGAREQEKPMRIKMFAYVGLVTIQVSISLMCAPAAAHRLSLSASLPSNITRDCPPSLLILQGIVLPPF